MSALSFSRFNYTVIGVLAIFAFVYFTVVSCVIVPWLSYSVPGVLNFSVLTFNTSLALSCFLTCVVLDPGSVPDDYAPDEEAAGLIVQVKRKGGLVRFCQKCGKPKPARAHHCRVCQRCVLRMDHHCPWINNCVGHANYKAFLLFLLYASAAVTHAMCLLVGHAWHAVHLRASHRTLVLRSGPLVAGPRASISWAILQTACTALTMPLTLGLLVLLFWNGFLAANNRTTIEYHEGVRANVQALQGGRQQLHPYHLGLCSNLHSICGPRPQRWLWLDTGSADGNGLVYPTTYDSEKQLSFL